MRKYKFPIYIEKDNDGYFAMCPQLQGCYTQGETYEGVLENIKDAIKLIVQDMKSQGEKILQMQRKTLKS